MRLMTYPVALLICNEVRCVPHIERDDLFKIRAAYVGTDKKYSGYDIYADMETGELYAVDAW